MAPPSSASSLHDLLAAAVAGIGGGARPGQLAMAEAVAEAIDSGRHLVVQAGTGTGKSLAYLVPILAQGDRVVVATATIALQNQLVGRDLPRLVEAVEALLGGRPTYAILKGRRNYACLQKARDGSVEDEESTLFDPAPRTPLGKDILRLREWVGSTDTGDRDDLAPGVPDRAWAQVSVSARDCLGAHRCRYGDECFAERARKAAGVADIVVTNHALLAIDALEPMPVLSEHDVVVVDEAHELADRVTKAATDELRGAVVERAVSRAVRHAKGPRTEALSIAGVRLAVVINGLPLGRLDDLPGDLTNVLAELRDTARPLVTELARDAKDDSAVAAARRRRARVAVEDVHDVACRLLDHSELDVAWLEADAQGNRSLFVAPLSVAGLLRDALFAKRTVVLTSATLSLGGTFDIIARQVGLDPAEAVSSRRRESPAASDSAAASGRPATAPVTGAAAGGPLGGLPAQAPVTRATAGSVGGSPSGRAQAPVTGATTGQTAGQPTRPTAGDGVIEWVGIDVGSPFDYARQAILYVARHLPPPGLDGISAAALDELADLVSAAGGRTLGLFSSHRAAATAADRIRSRLAVPVLLQGDDATAALVRRFAADPPTCLFGTLSLWQGVDIPGPSCQLVVIDRIPFPRPDDPVRSARQKSVDEAGGNGFMAVSAAHAALLLAQGAGRLIRSTEDRGVVAVLDSRLATARYAGFLRASLPRFWYTENSDQVRRSLAAING